MEPNILKILMWNNLNIGQLKPVIIFHDYHCIFYVHLFTCSILYIAIVIVTYSVWFVYSDSFITNGSCYQIPVQMYLLWMCLTENFVTWSQYYLSIYPFNSEMIFFLEFYCPGAFYGHVMCFIIVAEWYINYIVIVSLKDSGP